jgi:hypothetical protein
MPHAQGDDADYLRARPFTGNTAAYAFGRPEKPRQHSQEGIK